MEYLCAFYIVESCALSSAADVAYVQISENISNLCNRIYLYVLVKCNAIKEEITHYKQGI